MAEEVVAAARDTAHPADEVVAIHDAAERLAAAWTRSYESAEGRVSTSQLRALMAVHRAGDLSVTQLADELGAMVSSASRLCDRLVAAGYLVRDQNPHSRRQILVRATSDGRRLLAEIRRFRLRELRAILSRMPKADRQALLRGLRAWDRAEAERRR